MKKEFDFYEFVGVILPGTLVVFFGAVFSPTFKTVLLSGKFDLGELGIFVLLAYIAGHLVQAVSNIWEPLFWKVQGGLPTSWVREEDQEIISVPQVEAMKKLIPAKLKLDLPSKLSEIPANRWRSITAQMYAAVDGASRSKRIDMFNGNFGLLRGIASAFLLLEIAAVYLHLQPLKKILGGVFVLQCLALYRMRRFGVFYARELFVQFLQLPDAEVKKSDGRDSKET